MRNRWEALNGCARMERTAEPIPQNCHQFCYESGGVEAIASQMMADRDIRPIWKRYLIGRMSSCGGSGDAAPEPDALQKNRPAFYRTQGGFRFAKFARFFTSPQRSSQQRRPSSPHSRMQRYSQGDGFGSSGSKRAPRHRVQGSACRCSQRPLHPSMACLGWL